VETIPSADSLIQNNIFQQITGPVVTTGACSGCVLAYNFDIDDIFNSGGNVYNWQQQSVFPHAVGDDHILIEGNQGAGVDSDNFHGTHHFITMFRNVFSGFQPNNGTPTTGDTVPLLINAFSRFYNIVGNVLGSTSLPHTNYELNISNSGRVGANTEIIEVGIGDEVPNDPNTGRTLMLWGNYDVVTGAARWCGNASNAAWATTCASTSEIPSAITNYANPIPSTTTLPASFYLTSKPTWWPSAKAWPPIGPDVTGGNIAGYAGHANTIPAADCYTSVMGGASNGTGSALSFNASSCYGQSIITSTPPSAPTNLTAVAR
jgi:hypothetical protein